MPKVLNHAQQAEYDSLRAFVGVVVDFSNIMAMPGMPEEAHPLVVLEKMHAQSPSMALRGLREAANDMVEMTKDLAGAELERLEALLRDAGAPSLDSMRSHRYRQVMAVLGRSKVRTEEECRLLLAELGDLESTSALQEELRELAERLVAEYEPDSERE